MLTLFFCFPLTDDDGLLCIIHACECDMHNVLACMAGEEFVNGFLAIFLLVTLVGIVVGSSLFNSLLKNFTFFALKHEEKRLVGMVAVLVMAAAASYEEVKNLAESPKLRPFVIVVGVIVTVGFNFAKFEEPESELLRLLNKLNAKWGTS